MSAQDWLSITLHSIAWVASLAFLASAAALAIMALGELRDRAKMRLRWWRTRRNGRMRRNRETFDLVNCRCQIIPLRCPHGERLGACDDCRREHSDATH